MKIAYWIKLIDNIEDITSWYSFVLHNNTKCGIQIINKSDLHMENDCFSVCKMFRSEFTNSKNKYTVTLKCMKCDKILN